MINTNMVSDTKKTISATMDIAKFRCDIIFERPVVL